MNRKTEIHYGQAATRASWRLPEAFGQSAEFLDFLERLSGVAKIERPILIVGERGTGKELAAARLHYLSDRWQGPIVALNCSALSPSLIESELFGHESGAFTGATARRQGRFEAADGGTLFLDEIGLIPVEVQHKILRVVEYGAFERVGSSDQVQVDARIVGATNADLRELAERGRFKRDLLDRLSFEVLFLPPLRERHGDVMLLARHFAARMNLEMGGDDVPQFSDRAVKTLVEHHWPGNVRELKNVVERAVYRSGGRIVDEIEFDPFRSPYHSGEAGELTDREEQPSDQAREDLQFPFQGKSLREVVGDVEFTALKQALERSRFHQGTAASMLGMTYHQFRGLYRKFKSRLDTLRGEVP